ncbi:uncharacterized protein LOC34623319 [Cyclospora cayetanensis]|uniref:Uncharacterized protein LOC34623319 n=1 Tax=Cyclospora cayetanensis TaxID=88456 RepID=A0A6P6RYK8_9EIME|nr:uncharacterized protein LOC34623319 [Cyclospora cayetanensis]
MPHFVPVYDPERPRREQQADPSLYKHRRWEQPHALLRPDGQQGAPRDAAEEKDGGARQKLPKKPGSMVLNERGLWVPAPRQAVGGKGPQTLQECQGPQPHCRGEDRRRSRSRDRQGGSSSRRRSRSRSCFFGDGAAVCCCGVGHSESPERRRAPVSDPFDYVPPKQRRQQQQQKMQHGGRGPPPPHPNSRYRR